MRVCVCLLTLVLDDEPVPVCCSPLVNASYKGDGERGEEKKNGESFAIS